MHNHNHSVNDREELLALIKYMASHNESHTRELSSLLEKLDFADDDAKKNLASAIEHYNDGNEFMNKAIELLTKGE